ncbi:unnamed protein product [Linum trigynum]|uniref:Uncharacterized protein n=1 Tax=Linum trigynum TaxID=586398 RepID=A0AAV2G7Q1_9ROSI
MGVGTDSAFRVVSQIPWEWLPINSSQRYYASSYTTRDISSASSSSKSYRTPGGTISSLPKQHRRRLLIRYATIDSDLRSSGRDLK